MKSIHQYIETYTSVIEGLFKNVGSASKKDVIYDWIKMASGYRGKDSDRDILIDDNNMIDAYMFDRLIGDLTIKDEDLLDNGKLPDYIKFKGNISGLYVYDCKFDPYDIGVHIPGINGDLGGIVLYKNGITSLSGLDYLESNILYNININDNPLTSLYGLQKFNVKNLELVQLPITSLKYAPKVCDNGSINIRYCTRLSLNNSYLASITNGNENLHLSIDWDILSKVKDIKQTFGYAGYYNVNIYINKTPKNISRFRDIIPWENLRGKYRYNSAAVYVYGCKYLTPKQMRDISSQLEMDENIDMGRFVYYDNIPLIFKEQDY